MPRPPDPKTLGELKAAVGRGSWFDSPDAVAPYLTDFRNLYHGATPLVLSPRSVDEVARILSICDREEVAVVPHGGNTSYCGGATPDEGGSQIVLSLRRLNRLRQIDAVNYSMIIEAGCTLAEAQKAARDADRLFPLSLGSEGTAQIGGNLSTNAGGTAVLRYGMMRDLVLGLEVVLADGRVLSPLRGAAGDQVTSFELMPRIAVEMTVKHIAGVANPLGFDCAWYLLIELSSPNPNQNLLALLTAELEDAAAVGAVKDAMLATSLAQAQAMWKLRESVPEAQRRHGASIKHDVSVPVSAIPTLIEKGTALALELAPEGDVVSYGHAGDGNLHFNLSQKSGADLKQFVGRTHALEHAMFDLVESLGGSISAEHGIGRLKAAEFARRADPVELALMHELKRALDPKGILNPGKVLCVR